MAGSGSSFAYPIVIVLSCHNKRKRKEWANLERSIAKIKEMKGDPKNICKLFPKEIWSGNQKEVGQENVEGWKGEKFLLTRFFPVHTLSIPYHMTLAHVIPRKPSFCLSTFQRPQPCYIHWGSLQSQPILIILFIWYRKKKGGGVTT